MDGAPGVLIISKGGGSGRSREGVEVGRGGEKKVVWG